MAMYVWHRDLFGYHVSLKNQVASLIEAFVCIEIVKKTPNLVRALEGGHSDCGLYTRTLSLPP